MKTVNKVLFARECPTLMEDDLAHVFLAWTGQEYDPNDRTFCIVLDRYDISEMMESDDDQSIQKIFAELDRHKVDFIYI